MAYLHTLKINNHTITTEFLYRQAQQDDVKQLRDLGLLSYGQYKETLGEENWKIMESNLSSETTYMKLLETSTGFVCEKNNKIIGMGFLVPHGHPTHIFKEDWAYIRLLGTDPPYAGQGIGKQLMRMCIDRATQSGEKTLALHTSEFQYPAYHIYETLGFRKVKELSITYGKQYSLYILDLEKATKRITYHRADEADVDVLNDYRMRFAIELSGEQSPELTAELKKQFNVYFTTAIANNSYIGCVARCGDEVAGIGGMSIREQPGNFKNLSGRWGYIMNMYTAPAFRRRGVCTGILKALIEYAASAGITAFELHATKEGELVYQQNGFEIHNEPTYRKYIARKTIL